MKKREELTSEYFLGSMIGEYIVSVHLPTLSTDMLKTNNVIQVDEKDTETHSMFEKILNNSNKSGSDTPEWRNYYGFNNFLANKYYPKELKCLIPKFGMHLIDTDEKLWDLKEGIIVSMWNSDCCAYHLEHKKIKVIKGHDFAWADEVHFELDKKENKSK